MILYLATEQEYVPEVMAIIRYRVLSVKQIARMDYLLETPQFSQEIKRRLALPLRLYATTYKLPYAVVETFFRAYFEYLDEINLYFYEKYEQEAISLPLWDPEFQSIATRFGIATEVALSPMLLERVHRMMSGFDQALLYLIGDGECPSLKVFRETILEALAVSTDVSKIKGTTLDKVYTKIKLLAKMRLHKKPPKIARR